MRLYSPDTSTSLRRPAAAARGPLSGLELRCPPLPQTLVEAMDLLDRPEQLEVGPVTDMVQRDPVVIARLLHVVNSAYYGLRHQIGSAERAVVMLGPVAVAGIVVGMNMVKLKAVMEGPAATCFNGLIRHTLATAFLSRHLLEGSPRAMGRRASRIGTGFTAGLLHDFGKIILVYNFPDEAVRFYQDQALGSQVAQEDERQLEQLLFGCDHTEAGEFVARKLGFPDQLTDVIRLHHAAAPTGRDARDRTLRAVHAANLASKAMSYAFTHPLAWEDVAEDPVWDQLLALDLGRYTTRADLFGDLQEQQEHLDAYIQSMVTPPAKDPPPASPSARRLPL